MSSSMSTLVRATGDSEHWLPPAGLLAEMDIRAGMNVCEIGAGPGHYTLSIGERTGPAGRVYAVEWRDWLMEPLRTRLSAAGVGGNVEVVAGRPARTQLAAAACDLVILADIWHELEDRDATLEECRRILRPEGRLAILEWRPEGLYPPGPPVEHRIPLRDTLCAAERKSWTLVHTGGAGIDGYLLVFEMADESVQS